MTSIAGVRFGRGLLPSSLAVFAFVSLSAAATAEGLDALAQAKVREATFEVVVAKPEKDPLTYEKALPLELLPYSVRTDKYNSLGTAFAIGENRFVTAAHVLQIGTRTQFGVPLLRTSNGRVLAIDRIVKYSSAKDFVVFSLQRPDKIAAFRTETKPKLDARVYAVGNALGDGIVVRDGVFTSETPEDRDGRWKWLRFSAAASPGNSGGPLLDETGKVIGMIAMKSPNENLNYALPIAHILDAPDIVALVDDRRTFTTPLFDATETQTLKFETPLPKTIPELAAIFAARNDTFRNQLSQALLKKEYESTFPRGDGSKQLLSAPRVMTFPVVLTRTGNGVWDARAPEKIGNASLGKDARLYFAVQGPAVMVRMQRPADTIADQFYGDSKQFMDLFLKSGAFNRAIGPEKVRVTSMGAAIEDTPHVDSYGRKWRQRVWNVPYDDTVMVALALPSPEGYFAIVRQTRTAALPEALAGMRAMTDFAYLTYQGTLQQWRDFLAQKTLLPDVFANLDLSYHPGGNLQFRSSRFDLTVSPATLQLSLGSTLVLLMTYYRDDGRVVWDVSSLLVDEERNARSYVNVSRYPKPDDAALPETKVSWIRLTTAARPYDARPYTDNDRILIRDIANTSSAKKGKYQGESFRYTVTCSAENKQSPSVMKKRLASLQKTLQILEH